MSMYYTIAITYKTSLGNGQERDFFTYAQGFRVNAVCTASSPAKMMCYVSIHVFKTMMPIPNSDTLNIMLTNKTMIFSTLFSIMNAVNQRAKNERTGVGGNSKLWRNPVIS